jgi:hypothetical protein
LGISKGCENAIEIPKSDSKIKALILISPVFNTNLNNIIKLTSKFENLFYLKCPTFLIHGKRDKVVKYIDTINLGKNIKNLFEWYPKKADHHNLISMYRSKLYSKLKIFLGQVENNKFTNSSSAEDETNCFSFKKFSQLKSSSKNVYIKFEDNFILTDESVKCLRDNYFTTPRSYRLGSEDLFEKFQENNLSKNPDKFFIDELIKESSLLSSCSSIEFKEEKCPFETQK